MTKKEIIEKSLDSSLKRKLGKELYDPLDEFIKRLKKKIKELFAPLYVSSFDQLNIIRLSKTSEALYAKLDEFNRTNYQELVKHARKWAEWILGKELSKADLKDLVNSYLKGYDPVTQYVYIKEVERKQMRMNEAILTAKEFQDLGKLHKAVQKAADLWFTQSVQYAIDLMDLSVTKAYAEDDQDEYFRWCTYGDEKVCMVCHERDGKIWPSDAFPPKPHYNCRCFKIPAYDTVENDHRIEEHKKRF